MKKPILNLVGIQKSYTAGKQNKQVLGGINLNLHQGEWACITGQNGSGKSSLFKIIAGELRPDKGLVQVHNQNLTKAPTSKRAQSIAVVHQDPKDSTCANLTIAEHLKLAWYQRHKTKKWLCPKPDWKLLTTTLKKLGLGLEHKLNLQTGLLSGGQRQCLALAMAIISKPKLLLLDEHTAALDPTTADKVMELTSKLVQDQNLTALMICHNPELIKRYQPKTYELKEGVLNHTIN